MMNPKVGETLLTNQNFTQAFFTSRQRPNSKFIGFSAGNKEYPLTYLRTRQVDPKDIVVHFKPVIHKGPNYLQYCSGTLSESEKPENISKCVLKYTSGPGWYCSTINMALASDSKTLEKHGRYIKQLKYSIAKSPIYFSGTVLRGLDMSRIEVQTYESLGQPFYIPSFTSTSKTRPFSGNALLVIDVSPEWSKYCMEIPANYSDYDEDEVLLSCYNRYSYERTEKSNGQRIIKLRLLGGAQPINYNPRSIGYYPRGMGNYSRSFGHNHHRIGNHPRSFRQNRQRIGFNNNQPFSYPVEIFNLCGWP